MVRDNALYRIALQARRAGINVLPIRPDGSKRPDIARWRRYQEVLATFEEIEAWFAHSQNRGLALVTGAISGGLIALDFDDPDTFLAWREYVLSQRVLRDLYRKIADGYEERTPNQGRHLLFRCPKAFQRERKLASQKLALRPAPSPKEVETKAETRAEGSLLIVYPSHGEVHPSGRPYFLLRGGVTHIQTTSEAEMDLLLSSVRRFDEMPREKPASVPLSSPVLPPTVQRPLDGERPGDLFLRDPAITWETLLFDWDFSAPKRNAVGHWERYLRHPGKEGPNSSATLNADGTDRLYCFSPSIGLPTNRYLNKFEFYTFRYFGGDFRAAARSLVEKGYAPRAHMPFARKA